MAIEFSCTCGKRLRAPEQAIGKRAKCNYCGTAVTVPDPNDPRWPPGAKRPENPVRVPDGPAAPAPSAQPSAIQPPPTPPPAPTAPKPVVPQASPVPPKPPIPQARPAVPQANVVPPTARPAPAAPLAIPPEPPPGDFAPLPLDDIDSLLDPADFAPIAAPTVQRTATDESNPYRAPRVEEPSKKKKKRGSSGDDSELTGGDWVLAIMCSGIACILGLIYVVQGKPKGAKLVGAAMLSAFAWTVIRVAITVALQNSR